MEPAEGEAQPAGEGGMVRGRRIDPGPVDRLLNEITTEVLMMTVLCNLYALMHQIRFN